MGYPVFYYDRQIPPRHYNNFDNYYDQVVKINHPLAEESENTWYLICVGDRVSPNGEQDIGFIKEALGLVKEAEGRVILRSTILPQLLSNLDFDYYLPEFLHEKRGVEECLRPYYFVIGIKKSAKNLPNFLMEWKDNAHKTFEGTAEQASYVKYISNIWNSLRIAFVNELGDAMIDSKLVGMKEAQKVTDFLFEKQIYLRYGKAFGGHCLPKDSLAFARAHTQNRSADILKAIPLSNDVHQRLENKLSGLVEWSSPWEYQSHISDSTDAFRFLFNRLLKSKHSSGFRKKIKPMVNPIINSIWGKNNLSDVRKTWNNLAKKNAMYFVNIGTPGGKKVNELELRQTGKEDYERDILNDDLIKRHIPNTKSASVLDIGTGIARTTEHVASDFGKVFGIDISEEMIKIARDRIQGVPNIILSVNDGQTLPFPDNSFDLIYSQAVFRFLPNVDSAASYLKEIKRTLKSGGIAKVQFRTGGSPRKWEWVYGVSFKPEEISELALSANLRTIRQQVDGVRNLWVWFVK